MKNFIGTQITCNSISTCLWNQMLSRKIVYMYFVTSKWGVILYQLCKQQIQTFVEQLMITLPKKVHVYIIISILLKIVCNDYNIPPIHKLLLKIIKLLKKCCLFVTKILFENSWISVSIVCMNHVHCTLSILILTHFEKKKNTSNSIALLSQVHKCFWFYSWVGNFNTVDINSATLCRYIVSLTWATSLRLC